MDEFCLLAELLPDFYWLSGGGGDICGDVGLFISQGFMPAVLVFFADVFAVGVAVVFAEVESVNTPSSAVDDSVLQIQLG